jgi:hypothetical protein
VQIYPSLSYYIFAGGIKNIYEHKKFRQTVRGPVQAAEFEERFLSANHAAS